MYTQSRKDKALNIEVIDIWCSTQTLTGNGTAMCSIRAEIGLQMVRDEVQVNRFISV